MVSPGARLFGFKMSIEKIYQRFQTSPKTIPRIIQIGIDMISAHRMPLTFFRELFS
jgi:hypothetical protein